MKKLIILVLTCMLAMCLSGCGQEAASIGIIGGADGPTAIFVASRIIESTVCGFVGVLVVIALVVFMIYRRKKKK